tara:strand:+ start:519 stop:929 length:411 start_codon:yes stop_codon:yes gene_type:complete
LTGNYFDQAWPSRTTAFRRSPIFRALRVMRVFRFFPDVYCSGPILASEPSSKLCEAGRKGLAWRASFHAAITRSCLPFKVFFNQADARRNAAGRGVHGRELDWSDRLVYRPVGSYRERLRLKNAGSAEGMTRTFYT